MISNERHWPSSNLSQRKPYYEHPKTPVMRPATPEQTIESRRTQIERKQILVMLKENARGRFVRIAEEVSGRTNSIIIPVTGLREFQKMLNEMVNAAESLPPAEAAT